MKKCLFLLSIAFWMPESISCSVIFHITYLNFKNKVKKRRAIVYNYFNNCNKGSREIKWHLARSWGQEVVRKLICVVTVGPLGQLHGPQA